MYEWMAYVEIPHCIVPRTLGSENPGEFDDAVSFIALSLKGVGELVPVLSAPNCVGSSSPGIVTWVCTNSGLCHRLTDSHGMVRSLRVYVGGAWVQKSKIEMVSC